MIKKRLKMFLIAIIGLGIGLSIPFINTEASIIDAYTCKVAHSGSGKTCTNTTYGYQSEGGGTFINTFRITYKGAKSSIKINKLEYFASKVSKGKPYYISSWITTKGKTTYYNPAASKKFLSTKNKLSFSPNKSIGLKGDNAMLRIHSNLSGGKASVNYDVTIIPK